MNFKSGELYHRRKDIHGKFKGQERGGMITPAAHKVIFLVTGESGRQHGYEDEWSDGGSTFLYYGEGQVGDMQFTKGNLALRDHVANGKDVHLFQAVPGLNLRSLLNANVPHAFPLPRQISVCRTVYHVFITIAARNHGPASDNRPNSHQANC